MRGDFLSTTKGGRASWGWSGVLVGLDIIRTEGTWCVGNSLNIQVHVDQWISTKKGFQTEIIPSRDDSKPILVNSLIRPNKQWNA